MNLRGARFLFPVLVISLLAAGACRRQSPPRPEEQGPLLSEEAWRAEGREAIEKGLSFLRSRDPDRDGRWARSAGITAVVLLAHFQSPREFSPGSNPGLWKGLTWLESLQHPNGAIYPEQEGNANYITSVSILAMVLSGDPRFADTVNRARDYLVDNQLTGDSVYAGGFGYQDKAKTKDKPYADIVNTEFAMEALHAAGLPADHPAWKRAVEYLERCQHNSEYNDAAWVSDVGEYRGGFVYHPRDSKAKMLRTAGGKEILLPYGSVTYAGIKSMIYAHLERDDPRVKAAVDWIKKHWTLSENPGFDVTRDPNLGRQGYFYYFVTFAKALHALGVDVIEDEDGVPHPWRREVVSRIVALQNPDGSWKNVWHDRWYESVEELATSYAVIALSFALMDA